MRTIKTISLLLLILLFSSQAMAGGYSVSGVGLRAISMGGAFRAIADDWSAAYYNPAGLVNIFENQFNFGFDLYNNRPEFTPSTDLNGYSNGYYSDQRYPNDQVVYTPHISGVILMPVFEDVSFGFSIFQPFDYVSEWDIFRLSPTYNQYVEDTNYVPVTEARVPFPKYAHHMNLDIVDFQPTFAMELIEDQLSVGIGISARKGSFLNSQLSLIPNEIPGYNFRPYENFVQISELDAEGWGFGFNLGVLYNLNEKLTFGASYKSKSTISLSGDVTASFYAPGNRHVADSTSNSTLAKEIFLGEIYTAVHNVDADWTVPSQFGFGLAYWLTEKVQAALDFSYTMWSQYEDIEMTINSSQGLTGNEFIDGLTMPTNIINRWNDAFRVSLGIEGQLSEKMTLRGGYSFDQSPIPDENANIYFNTPTDKHQLSGGFSVIVNKVEFFGALGVQISPEKTVDELNDLNDDGIMDNLSGIYSNVSFLTSFGLTVRF